MSNVKPYKAWFEYWSSMAEIGEFLVAAGVMRNFEHDYEDTYEWIEGDAVEDQLHFNIWRKHRDGVAIEDEPVNVYLMFEEDEPADDYVASIARIIAKGLECSVSLGTIENYAAEEYDYKVDKVIR